MQVNVVVAPKEEQQRHYICFGIRARKEQERPELCLRPELLCVQGE